MCKKKNKVKDPNKKSFMQEFKAFITKGNVLDLAVGVVIGGSFNAIVTALVNMLMSLCTFWIPGGIDGMVFALPAVKASQEGKFGQSFAVNNIDAIAEKYATADLPVEKIKELIPELYNDIGGTYFAKGAALVNVGAFINAIINFLLMALTLFVIIKVFKSFAAKRAAFEAKLKAKFAKPCEEETAETEEKPAE